MACGCGGAHDCELLARVAGLRSECLSAAFEIERRGDNCVISGRIERGEVTGDQRRLDRVEILDQIIVLVAPVAIIRQSRPEP